MSCGRRKSVAGSAHALSRLQHSLGRILSGKHRVAHSIVSSHRTCQQTADQEHQFPIIQPLFLLLSPFSPPRWHPPPGFLFRMRGLSLSAAFPHCPSARHSPAAYCRLPMPTSEKLASKGKTCEILRDSSRYLRFRVVVSEKSRHRNHEIKITASRDRELNANTPHTSYRQLLSVSTRAITSPIGRQMITMNARNAQSNACSVSKAPR